MFGFFYTERTTSEYDKYKVGQRHGCLRKKTTERPSQYNNCI